MEFERNGIKVNVDAAELEDIELVRAVEEITAEADSRGLDLWKPIGGVAFDGSIVESTLAKPTWEQQLELSGLSPERREKATTTRDALVQKYESEGYSADNFSLIKTSSEGKHGKLEDVFAVVLSATRAIDLGDPKKTYDPMRSWDSIDPAKPIKQFMVEVNGQEEDTRKGLTLEVMSELAARDPKIDERIWETGAPERADDHLAPVVVAYRGVAYRDRSLRGNGSGDVVFRPAVVIE